MIVTAIKVIGTLHAIPAFACFCTALDILRLPGDADISRNRRRYVAARALFASLALTACVVSSWLLPSMAWAFAFASLAMYLPPPAAFAASAAPPSRRAAKIISYVPFVLGARITGVILLGIATFVGGA